MRNTKQTVELKTDKDVKFSDELDVLRHITKVSSEIGREGITDDAVLFEPTQKEIDFVSKQYDLAKQMQDFIAEKTIAKQVRRNMMASTELLMVLRRNTKNNFMVKKILERNNQEQEEDADSFAEKVAKAANEHKEKEK